MLANFIKALILTEAVEGVTAFLLGYREWNFHKTLILINLITNPLINYIIHVLFFFGLFENRFLIVITLEIMVVIGEWGLLAYVFSRDRKSLLLLSIFVNVSSFTAGSILSIF